MAEIYLCSVRGPEGFEKKIVVKRIRALLAKDPDFVQMFIAEARLASLLNHPNIVQIFDFDKDDDSYYLAMEYIRGQSLWSLHKRARELMIPIPTTLVAHIGAEVARGLHYVHRLSEKGQWLELVHRDVTPHNVLLSYDGAVKLTDFGIAKAGTGLSAPGKLKGKFAYMSPEQARGEAVDARSDVFALGIVLWELLTGGRLFDGDGDLAILRSVQHSIIPPPARLNPEVPPALDSAVTKALQRDPAMRYQTALELERALMEHVFTQAKGLEDTDVSGFLKQLFGSSRELKPSYAISTATGLNAASRSHPAEQKTQTVGARGPGRRAHRSYRRLWRWVFLSGVAMLLVSTSALVLHLQPRGRSAIGMATASAPEPKPSPELAPAPSPVPEPEAVPPSPPRGDLGPASLVVSAPPQPAALRRRRVAQLRPPPCGTLVLQVTPWAQVYIDGKSQGEVTGVRRFKLRSGKHRLVFKHPRAVEERTISVSSNQELHQGYQAFAP